MIEIPARGAKVLGAAAFDVALFGFFGAAYCDYEV
jgi:hypothetical protein